MIKSNNVQSGDKMGVIYKLKPEIIDFILEEKKTNTILSCRSMTTLVEEKFQVKLSKSSINSIIKQQGLSMPVGRRQKKKRKTPMSIKLQEALRPFEIPAVPEQEQSILIVQPIVPEEVISTPAVPPEPIAIPEPKQTIPIIQPVVPEEVKASSVEPAEPEVIAKQPEAHAISKTPIIPEPLPPSEPEPLPPAPKVEEQVVEIKAEEPVEIECTGAILLKAADYLLGGSYYFSEAIQTRLDRKIVECLAKTESLIYQTLFEGPKEAAEGILCSLTNKRLPLEVLSAYINELQSVKQINMDLLRIISNTMQEIRCVKVNISDGSILYLDGQLHTIWSTPHIPHDFSATTYNIKSYINKYFFESSPVILFMAPGYDVPTKEFFSFILSLDSSTKKITQLTLCNNTFEEIERIPVNLSKKQFFAFGLWPWQFVEHRKVKKIGEFKPCFVEPLNKEIYAADIEIELTQPNVHQSITLKGSALKISLAEKTRLIILTNLADGTTPCSQWLNLYINHWPNFEEAFHDYSRKIELFTYTGISGKFFSKDMLNLDKEPPSDISIIFSKYLEALDLYVKWHFLPTGYENKDFLTIKEQFYNLKTIIRKEHDRVLVAFKPPQGFQFLKDLEYACRRLNEREIINPQKMKLWFSV